VTARSLAAAVPLGALSTLALLGVATFVAVTAVTREPTGSSTGQSPANGTRVLSISSDGARSLTTADVDALARAVPDLVGLSRVALGSLPVTAGGHTIQLRIQGVDPAYPRVADGSPAAGTFFSPQDASAASAVAVLGQTAANGLFAGQSAIGQTIRIRGVPFTVIGVLAALAGSAADDPDSAVLIPFQTSQVRLFGPNALDGVLLRIGGTSQTDAVRQRVQQLLRQRHQIRPGQPDGFSVATAAPAADGVSAETTLQSVAHLLAQYRQYVCEAKGLCARAQPG
jgi:putative ABC transport system permease protein